MGALFIAILKVIMECFMCNLGRSSKLTFLVLPLAAARFHDTKTLRDLLPAQSGAARPKEAGEQTLTNDCGSHCRSARGQRATMSAECRCSLEECLGRFEVQYSF